MPHFEIKICCVFWIICWVSFYFWIDSLEGHAMEIVIFWIGNWSRVNIVAFSGRLLWGFIFCIIEIVGIMVDGVLLCCFVGTTCSVGYGIDWAWTSSCYNCFFFFPLCYPARVVRCCFWGLISCEMGLRLLSFIFWDRPINSHLLGIHFSVFCFWEFECFCLAVFCIWSVKFLDKWGGELSLWCWSESVWVCFIPNRGTLTGKLTGWAATDLALFDEFLAGRQPPLRLKLVFLLLRGLRNS